ncbi:cytochrome P450 [Aestuariivirga sp.]|uniref:cytochrome P450 n=1 Tax=Aestuariivirga sp. TaxID=2650926 RepID=UPI0039E6D7F6
MSKFIPPYPKPMRKRGMLLQLLLRPAKFLRSRSCTISSLSDRAYGMHMGELGTPGRRVYIANQPELVKRVLVDEAEGFPKAKVISDMLELLLGDSIFVSNGEVWKRQRRMMDPAFAQARIKIVFDLMLDAADALFQRMDAKANGGEMNIDEEMMHVAADIIFRTIFSRPLEGEEARLIFAAFVRFQEAAFAKGIAQAVGVPGWAMRKGTRVSQESAAEIRGVLDPIVKARFDSFHAGEAQTHQDILQSLVSVKDPETGTHFDLRELCEQVAMLFLAGHETSASALSWTLYLIANDQSVQEAMHKEAVKIFGDREPKFQDMKRLEATRNAFAEALRLYPPVAFLPRAAARECPMRDKVLPKGSMVSVSPWLMQRHRRYWTEPDTFDPSRFDDPATTEAQRQCYIPFSKGPRVCLGASFALQEAAIILSGLVRRYTFDPVPGFEPKPIARLTVRSENGIRLKVSRRPSPPATFS